MEVGYSVHHLWSVAGPGGNHYCLGWKDTVSIFEFVGVTNFLQISSLFSSLKVCYDILYITARRSLFFFMLFSALAQCLLTAGPPAPTLWSLADSSVYRASSAAALVYYFAYFTSGYSLTIMILSADMVLLYSHAWFIMSSRAYHPLTLSEPFYIICYINSSFPSGNDLRRFTNSVCFNAEHLKQHVWVGLTFFRGGFSVLTQIKMGLVLKSTAINKGTICALAFISRPVSSSAS